MKVGKCGAVVVALTLTACSPARPSAVAESPVAPPRHRTALVTRVVDGDTIEVLYRGRRALDVRFIGIDTPETVAPGEPVECGGPAASHFTEQRLEAERVQLEFDVERLDRYGRTLAYVWIDDELFNEVLVAEGYAQVTTYPPNVKYVDRFLDAQRRAREANLGLWSACTDEPPDLAGGGGSRQCDRISYPDPDVCIPPYPPDLNCDDIPYTNVAVRPPDPHGFDGNDDGVGCEG